MAVAAVGFYGTRVFPGHHNQSHCPDDCAEEADQPGPTHCAHLGGQFLLS